MHQPRKWWIGLPALAGLAYVAASSLTPQIEADLAARVATRLSVRPEQVSVSGRDVALSGVAPDARALLRDVSGPRRVVVLAGAPQTEPAPARTAPPPEASIWRQAAAALSTVSPYTFEATRKGAVLTLAGFAPDAAARARLADFARRRFFDAAVDDRLAIAPGAPPDFVQAAEAALAALARLDDGGATFSDASLALSGAPRLYAARAEIAAALDAQTPPNFKREVQLVAPAPGAPVDRDGCRAAFAQLSRTPPRFESDDAALSEDSTPLLDSLTALVLRCQIFPIEVAGHLDEEGEAARDRSKRRAARVVDKFIKAGADPFHVWAMGYGGERPLAPNDSEENREKNRRIEFIVR